MIYMNKLQDKLIILRVDPFKKIDDSSLLIL